MRVMQTIDDLLAVADAYKIAAAVERDRTVSHRVFGDSKKLSALRVGAGIDIRRFNSAMEWFNENWPPATRRPKQLTDAVGGVQ